MDSGRSPGRRGAAPQPGLLEAALEHYGVELRSSSRWGEQQVCCPAHSERRPSLTVNVEKGVAFCFACEFKGTALHLVMAMESCSRDEARKRLEVIGNAAGVAIPRPAGRYRRPGDERATGTGRTRYVPPGRRGG
ncbi:MAG: CHC2 zinc finger domain-containing protein [Humibacter sp.]